MGIVPEVSWGDGRVAQCCDGVRKLDEQSTSCLGMLATVLSVFVYGGVQTCVIPEA